MSESTGSVESRPPYRVLIVEDEPIIAADIANQVAALGHIVTGIAASEDEAISRCTSDPADLGIFDIQLIDGSSGIDAANRLTRSYPNLATIFLTAFPERLLTGERPEPTYLITKPFQPETLKMAIGQVLKRHRNEQPADVVEPAHDDRFARALAATPQDPLGVRFVARRDQLQIATSASALDSAASQRAEFSALHSQVSRLTESLLLAADNIDQQYGWDGFKSTIQTFHSALDLPSNEVHIHASLLWTQIVEIGSFLEMNSRIIQDRGVTNMAPLDAASQRKLESLIAIAAPWVRLLPSARELDEQTASFRTQNDRFEAASEVFKHADANRLLSGEDIATLSGLVEAARRGDFQGEKAKTRSARSAINLGLAALIAVSGFYGGAVQSHFSERSELAEKVGAFLAAALAPLEEVLIDATPDVRFAVQAVVEHRKTPEIDLDSTVATVKPE